MASIKEHFEDFHDRHVCFATKTIKMFGDINAEMKDRTITNLHLLDQTTGEITILLSSEGGCVTQGLEIYDEIRLLKNYVKIICSGEIASMATIILQAADKGRRFLKKNSYFLLHEGESERSGNEETMKQQKKFHDWQENTCIDIYWKKIKEKKPRYTRKSLVERIKSGHDEYLLPKEIIELGLADEILDPEQGS